VRPRSGGGRCQSAGVRRREALGLPVGFQRRSSSASSVEKNSDLLSASSVEKYLGVVGVKRREVPGLSLLVGVRC
jgi:hypothetical protein